MNSARPSFSSRIASSVVKMRRSFVKMSMREKALVLLFAFALVGFWFSWQLDRHQRTQESVSAAHRTAAEHEMILAYAPSIQANYEHLISLIDLDSLPAKDEVASQIDALVRQAGFSDFSLGQPRTEEGTGFKFHTVQLVVQKEPYQKMKNFTETLKAELPFVSLERIVIQAQARDDQFLDVRYVLKSIEHTK